MLYKWEQSQADGSVAAPAAAAALGAELTLPGIAQSVVLTRTSGRASAMPSGEKLEAYAATGATLAIHLSIHAIDKVVAALLPHYGADCPVAVVYRASWPEERRLKTFRAYALEYLRTMLPTLQELLGRRFCRAYVSVKRKEYETFFRVISSWEREFLLLSV